MPYLLPLQKTLNNHYSFLYLPPAEAACQHEETTRGKEEKERTRD